jgi:hypothetical protein
MWSHVIARWIGALDNDGGMVVDGRRPPSSRDGSAVEPPRPEEGQDSLSDDKVFCALEGRGAGSCGDEEGSFRWRVRPTAEPALDTCNVRVLT